MTATATQKPKNADRTSISRDAFELKALGLRKSFGGVEVLHGVDIELRGGEVLAVLGENGAGKSTAIKIISGAYQEDAGTLQIDGETVKIDSPREGQDYGIRVIYQEMTNAPTLTVYENVFLGHLPNRGGLVRWSDARKRTEAALADLNVSIDPKQLVSELSVAELQIVEIARALVADARLLVFDEPTSALSPDEVDNLFSLIRRLRDEGVAIIYITHKLPEVPLIADRVIIFRDGDLVAVGPVDDFDRDRIVEAMTGESLQAFAHHEHDDGLADETEQVVALSVTGASLPPLFENVDLEVRKGEIVGLFGRMGCGAQELGEALFGLHTLAGGQITILGVDGHPSGPRDAKNRGLGFVPVDRKTQGIFANLSAGENLTVAAWENLAKRIGFLPPSVMSERYNLWRDRLSIRGAGGSSQEMDTLSGGNQQKVVLGRWLENNSSVLVLAEPTRGVDVGARAEIYEVLEQLATDDIAILVISTDAEEVLRISDRIVVMTDGKVTDVVSRADASMARLAASAAAVV
ncbi:MAG: sugar ABC transporter ATP-binding protein [Chloroflexi bacterium]|nr:sugar ABC transporter ATP-binding protein [Chloroflexota bacterium]